MKIKHVCIIGGLLVGSFLGGFKVSSMIWNGALIKCKKDLDDDLKRRRKVNTYPVDDDGFIFEQQQDATEVLGQMHDLLLKYNYVTIADLKDLIGCVSTIEDNLLVWTNLDKANIEPYLTGFILRLPEPITYTKGDKKDGE